MDSSKKKIAINTLIIYIRLVVVTLIGLFSVRFVVQELGASDYGLYNVVGSIIVMANTLGIALVTTTRRYINIELGKPDGDLQKIFNICVFVHALFAVFMFFIIELVGTWYIDNYLNIASEKLSDAHFIFQISTIVACVSMIIVPYQALLEAYQKFGHVAVVDITNAILKFAFVLLLIPYDGNKLRFYAISMSLLTASSFILYHLICFKQYHHVVSRCWRWDKKLVREILIFNNYTALGATSYLGRSQGSTMIINYFFGTVTNAGFAISYQIQNYVQLFVNNLATASAPQITQAYGSGDIDRAVIICSKVNRITILLMSIVSSSLLIELDFILQLWLGEYPAGTQTFCFWTIITALVGSFSTSLSTIIQASGKIKYFQLFFSSMELAILPASFVFFLYNYPPETILICFVVFGLTSRFASLYMMKRIIEFDSQKFIKESYLPPIAVILALGLWYVFYQNELVGVINPFVGILLTSMIASTLSVVIGLNRKEQSTVWKVTKQSVSYRKA